MFRGISGKVRWHFRHIEHALESLYISPSRQNELRPKARGLLLRCEELETRVMLSTYLGGGGPLPIPAPTQAQIDAASQADDGLVNIDALGTTHWLNGPTAEQLANPPSGIMGDPPGGNHTFEIRIGSEAFRSLQFVVGSNPLTRQVKVRRFDGADPEPITLTAKVIDGDPAQWNVGVSSSSFTLGRAPTTSTADFNKDGAIDNTDVAAFNSFETGPGVHIAPQNVPVAIGFDLNGDLAIDETDRALMMAQFTGPITTPWEQDVQLSVAALPTTPLNAYARVQITATDTVTGEARSTFAEVVKQPYAPGLGLQENFDFTTERSTKISYGSPVTFNLNLINYGANGDIFNVAVNPVSGFTFQTYDSLRGGLATSQFLMQPGGTDIKYDPSNPSLPVNINPFVLAIIPTTNWPRGSVQTFTVTATSAGGGLQTSFNVELINVGSLWSPSDLTLPGGLRHLVRPGDLTTYPLTVTNNFAVTKTFTFSSTQQDGSSNWSTQFDQKSITLLPGTQATVTFKVFGPTNGVAGSVADWTLTMTDGSTFTNTDLVGAQVTALHKIIYVGMDGLEPEYFGLNAAGTGPGSAGDWLMPNLQAFYGISTYYTNASTNMLSYTDPNHTSAQSGANFADTGISNVFNIFYGQDQDGAPIIHNADSSILRYGPDGAPLQTFWDVAKSQDPNAHTVYATGKGWMPYYFESQSGVVGTGPVDTVLEGRTMPLYINNPTSYIMGNPKDPPPDPSIRDWGLLPGIFPSDQWIMNGSIKIIENEDPDAMYILLANTDDAQHAYGTAWDPSQWNTSTVPNLNSTNPRAARENVLNVMHTADIAFGNLITELKNRGTLNDTYVVMLADHGFLTHHPQPIDIPTVLNQAGYNINNDYFIDGGSSFAGIWNVAPQEQAKFEATLENATHVAPGLTAAPWIVLNRQEMLTGIDAKTGIQVAPPGALYSTFFIQNDNPTDGLEKWPDFFVIFQGGWQSTDRKFHLGEDSFQPGVFAGGHAGLDTLQIPIFMHGPGIPNGQVITSPVGISQIAPTLYKLQGWPFPGNVDAPPLPGINPPTLSITNVQLADGASGSVQAVFNVNLSIGWALPVSVDFTTADGTAVQGSDYLLSRGTLTFNPGETSKQITVFVLGAVIYDANETFNVNLSNPVNATLANAQGVGTILNDDPPPTISINNVQLADGSSGTVAATFTISMIGNTDLPATVNFSTADGTVHQGLDYLFAQGQVTLTPTQPTRQITVLVVGSVLYKPTETFFVNLSNPINATLAVSQGVGTILNDDPLPAVSINDVRITEPKSGTTPATFTVSLSLPSVFSISLNFATADGTAKQGVDYLSARGPLTFNPGDTSKQITVLVVGDMNNGPDGTFYVNLSGVTNATLARSKGTGTIVDQLNAQAALVVEHNRKSAGHGTLVNPDFAPPSITSFTNDTSKVVGSDPTVPSLPPGPGASPFSLTVGSAATNGLRLASSGRARQPLTTGGNDALGNLTDDVFENYLGNNVVPGIYDTALGLTSASGGARLPRHRQRSRPSS